MPKRSLPYDIPGVRYELWLKGQDAIRRCSARGDAQVLKGFNQRGHHAVDPCGPLWTLQPGDHGDPKLCGGDGQAGQCRWEGGS